LAINVTRPIEEVCDAVQRISENNDFTQSIPENGDKEIQALGVSINNLVNNLQKSISKVKSAIGVLKDSSEQVASMTHDINDNISQQESECNQVASAATQLQSTATEVANNAARTADQTSQANQTALTTQNIVVASNEASVKLADELSQGKNILSRVAKESNQISAVLDVINGIAEQTNLLALNAAIEAARAGEQGRGFAVVADEVRQLAKRTQSATTEIEEMINNLQTSSTEAVGAIERGDLMADQSVENSNKISESLSSVTEFLTTISDMNAQIATASEQQSSVVTEIGSSANSINQAASENSERAAKLNTMADNLNDMSKELHRAISRYNI
jgi:methyl-accepting chemotaxis protein